METGGVTGVRRSGGFAFWHCAPAYDADEAGVPKVGRRDVASWPCTHACVRCARQRHATARGQPSPRPVAAVRLDVAYGARGVRRVPRAGTCSQWRSRGICTLKDARYNVWQSRNVDARALSVRRRRRRRRC
jgi:hypothetical protein